MPAGGPQLKPISANPDAHPAAAIEMCHLTKRYNRVVDDISFEVAAGELFGFLGPNGAGNKGTEPAGASQVIKVDYTEPQLYKTECGKEGDNGQST